MMFNHESEEPMIVVEGFGEVHESVAATVAQLLDSGHDITVDDDGGVTFDPPIWRDLHEHLASCPTEIEGALALYAQALLRRELQRWQ